MSSYYNPRAYVPGGSTRRVARAIQTLGRSRPPRRDRHGGRVPGSPGVRPIPVVDPFLTRANTLAKGMFSPLFAELGTARAKAEANARAAYGTHAAGLENALKASGAAIPAAYDQGISQSAKVNEAVANRLAGQGVGASQALAAQLAQISANPGQAAQIAQSYQDASNAGFARDSADLQHLIGRRSEAAGYQAKLPSIGRLAVNQDLASALSEQRGYFGEQETALRQSAADRAFDLYGQFRDEDFATKQNASQIRQQTLNRQQEERMSIRALKEAAVTEAEKRAYDAQEAALQRQHERELANLDANVDLSTDNPPKPDKVTGPPNQQWITVNGKKVKNPNYVPPSKGGTSTNDNWTTAGSAKRNRVIELALTATINPNNISYLRGTYPNPNQVMVTVMNKVNNALKLGGVPANQVWGSQATELRRAIFQQLVGKKFRAADGTEYELTQEDVNNFTRKRK